MHRSIFSHIERILKQPFKFRKDRHYADTAVAVMLCLAGMDGKPASEPATVGSNLLGVISVLC